MMRFGLFLAVLLFFFAGSLVAPDIAIAQTSLASYAGCSGTDCSACNLVSLANGIITWLIGFLFIIFAVILAFAGFGLVTSGGNHHALDEAKNRFVNAFIGLIIVLAAWLIVDTLMRGLVGRPNAEGQVPNGQVSGWLYWNEVECYDQPTPAAGEFNPVTFEPNESMPETANPNVIINDYGPGGLYGLEGGETYTPSPSADNGLDYNEGIRAQLAHASPALISMLNCIGGRVPANVGRVSSISDSKIVDRSKTWQQCAAGQCQHVAGSYHYGGSGSCIGRSYAADFGDEANVAAICGAANSCGRVHSCSVHNGNHVHLQIPISC
jgi:hypothetical protein